ncbi:hypothetical protein L484_003433 [Morus notabilis]|uniref:Uncharacterized protein n=1 Tax=Morus notabilis TaxID=981085 RepID=W9SC96_9ROSA|nr:hypothetical protein L484_003433 [Morus notabilis]
MFRIAEPKNKKQKISHENNTYLWHLRLGYINLNRIERLVKDGPLRELTVGELLVCESCLEVPSKSVPKTPLELWNGQKLSLRHIRIWGCPTHVLRQKTGKLEPWSEVCIFVGYPQGTRGGLFYSQADQKVFVSTNATFLEHDYMIDFKPISKIVLEELLSDKIGPQPARVVGPRREKSTVPDQTPMAPHHSGRVSRLPDRYTGEAQIITADDGKEDPSNFKDAMDDSDKEE